MIETLNSLNSPGAAPLKIAMENDGGPAARNANGKYVLEARLINAGPRNVSVLLVSDDGGVQNINRVCSRCLSMEGDVMKVRLPLQQPPRRQRDGATAVPARADRRARLTAEPAQHFCAECLCGRRCTASAEGRGREFQGRCGGDRLFPFAAWGHVIGVSRR